VQPSVRPSREHAPLVLDFKPCETIGNLHQRLFSYALAAPTGEGTLAAFLRNGGYYPNEAAVSPNEAEFNKLLWSGGGRGLLRGELVINSAEETRAPAVDNKPIHPGLGKGRDSQMLWSACVTSFSISGNLNRALMLHS
jgi:hypothetical protein